MGSYAKYLFDNEFGAVPAVEEIDDLEEIDVPPPAPTFSEEELSAAKNTARTAGIAAGRAEALSEIQASIDAKLDQLLQNCDRVVSELEQHRARVTEEATKLALTAAKTLAPALIAQQPGGELMRMFDECVGQLRQAPQVIIKIASSDIELVREQLDARAAVHGFDGRVVVLCDDDLRQGDCVLEWADGGVSRRLEDILQAIDEIVARYFPEELAHQQEELADGRAEDVSEAGELSA